MLKAGLDVPNESDGYKGRDTAPGHLLDACIGQYDTYTPIQLAQYTCTLANMGKKFNLISLLNHLKVMEKEIDTQLINLKQMFKMMFLHRQMHLNK